MQNRNIVRYKIMDGKSSNGVGSSPLISDFRHAVVQISTSGNANLTLKCQSAICVQNSVNPPNFSTAASSTNRWDFVQMISLNTGDPVDGDTGIVFSGTDSVQQFEVNTNLIDFISFQISEYVAGSVNVDILLSNNE